jgi:hypothetical protein
MGFEGMVSKLADRPYRAGQSKDCGRSRTASIRPIGGCRTGSRARILTSNEPVLRFFPRFYCCSACRQLARARIRFSRSVHRPSVELRSFGPGGKEINPEPSEGISRGVCVMASSVRRTSISSLDVDQTVNDDGAGSFCLPDAPTWPAAIGKLNASGGHIQLPF